MPDLSGDYEMKRVLFTSIDDLSQTALLHIDDHVVVSASEPLGYLRGEIFTYEHLDQLAKDGWVQKTFYALTGRIHETPGPEFVVADTTMKSSEGIWSLLAPTRELVYGHKAYNMDERFVGKWRPINDADYRNRYLKLLTDRYKSNPSAFEEMLSYVSVMFACYCSKGAFCHRHILVDDFFPLIATHFGYKYTKIGEINDPKDNHSL